MLLERMVKFPGVFQNPSIIVLCMIHRYQLFIGSKNSFISFPGLLAESYKLQNLTFAFRLLFLLYS